MYNGVYDIYFRFIGGHFIDNCIGNKGPKSSPCPIIGNNVEIGVGAKIIGGVTIADDIVIGAGAVVVDSFLEKGIIIGGVPARKLS